MFPRRCGGRILACLTALGKSHALKVIPAAAHPGPECTIIGGHSIRDDETKFGYSVTGLIDPAKVLANGGAKVGDRLLFTKALGTGVISTAIKKGVAKQSWIDGAVASMTTLNKKAADVITARVGTAASGRPVERSSTESRRRPVCKWAAEFV